MRRFLILGALLAAGCPGKTDDTAAGDDSTADDSGDDSAVDDSGDGGDDSGPGGDSEDTGDDPHDDTAGDDTSADDTSPPDDSGPDDSGTDDTAPSDCTVRDLVLVAEARDSTGVAGTSFATSTALVFAGVVQNPCSADISFETATACLVDSWQVVGASGIGMGTAEECATVVTSWTVPAGGSVEATLDWGRLTPDDWELTIDFAGVMPTASSTFTVY